MLVLIGIAALMAVPRFEAMAGFGGEDRAIRVLSGAVARAGDLAVLEGREQSLVIDLDGRMVSLPGDGEKVELPAVSIAVEREAGGFRENGVVRIGFTRWGDPEPARIRIGTDRLLSINPVTGELSER